MRERVCVREIDGKLYEMVCMMLCVRWGVFMCVSEMVV